jgi:hypothetical protein
MTPTPRTAKTSPAPGEETPASAASVYQQLRSHLAELKLHDAAEALPGVPKHCPVSWTRPAPRACR